MKLFSKDRTRLHTDTTASRASAFAAPMLRKLGRSISTTRNQRPVAHPLVAAHPHRDLLTRLQIPVNTATPDQVESEKLRDHGVFLARQERWEDIEALVRTDDQNRTATTSGTPHAQLTLFGARSDVVRAAEHALLHGKPAHDADFFRGVEALEFLLDDFPDSYPIALVVAHMHIDIAWAWRGAMARDDTRDANRDAFRAHFARAREILSDYCPVHLQSPALSAAQCALLPGTADPAKEICAAYEALIALAPENPRHMRTLGTYLLPRWYGSFEQLDLQARRIAAQTYQTWGAAGYTWVWFDALLIEPEGLKTLEIEYFLDGVADALNRQQNQHAANLLAAQLYRCWQHSGIGQHENSDTAAKLSALRDGFDMIVRTHLREIHPLIWGHAEIGFENTSHVISKERLSEKGRDVAMQAVALPFMNSLKAGHTINFSPEGITQISP